MATGGGTGLTSVVTSPYSSHQPVTNGHTVTLVDATAQTSQTFLATTTHIDETIENEGYPQRPPAHQAAVRNFLPQVRARLFGSASGSEAVQQSAVVTVYHRPTNWERTVSAVGSVAKVIVAPIKYLVWKPLKFFCTKVCDAKIYLFNHERYAAAKQAEFAVQQRERRDHACYMNDRCINATARMKVIEENLEAKAGDRVPYIRALSEMAPILKRRREALEENQAKPDDLEKFREFGVVPDERNNEFIEAMAEYNGKIAEFKVAEAEHNAAVALAQKKGRQPPAMPAILAEKPEAFRFKCEDEAVISAYNDTNGGILLKRKADLTGRLEVLLAELREVVPPEHGPHPKITSASQNQIFKEQIASLNCTVQADQAILANGTGSCREVQERIDANLAVIEFKQRLVDIFDIEQKLIVLDKKLAPVQAERNADIQEWKEGVVNLESGEVEQVGRDRLSLDAIKLDTDNLKTDSNGNVTHLAYVINRPLINPVREEHEDRDARNKGLVWRKASVASVEERPVLRYAAIRNRSGKGKVVGSCDAEAQAQHWYVRDEPVVHVKGYDKRHLAVEFYATQV